MLFSFVVLFLFSVLLIQTRHVKSNSLRLEIAAEIKKKIRDVGVDLLVMSKDQQFTRKSNIDTFYL